MHFKLSSGKCRHLSRPQCNWFPRSLHRRFCMRLEPSGIILLLLGPQWVSLLVVCDSFLPNYFKNQLATTHVNAIDQALKNKQGIYSLNGRTSHRTISCSFEAATQSLLRWQEPWQQHCRDTCQVSNRYDHYDMQYRGFGTSQRFGGRTFYRLVNRGPDLYSTTVASLNLPS